MNEISGFSHYHPPEWHPHKATWLSWPHQPGTWPSPMIDRVRQTFARFASMIAQGEQVHILVNDSAMENAARHVFHTETIGLNNITFHHIATNDAWIRDYGPSFLLTKDSEKILLNREFNSWGGKYPPFGKDNAVPHQIGKILNLPVYDTKTVLEGGAIDFNGQGTLITTSQCLLNENRNPGMHRKHMEEVLKNKFGVHTILWLNHGIEGDDTDGHIDNLARFVDSHTIVAPIEENKNDPNYLPLKKNAEQLKSMRDHDGKKFKIIFLPMPDPVITEGCRLPASYANFYITNKYVVVPAFRCPEKDRQALETLKNLFPEREVVSLDATEIVYGLGTFHCLSMQEPKAL